jgi:Na+/glutamate symporter
MDNILGNSIINVCRILQKYNVEYMLIGGTAVALHGYYRHSVTLSGEITEKPE